jgi:hypothetical protein
MLTNNEKKRKKKYSQKNDFGHFKNVHFRKSQNTFQNAFFKNPLLA